MTYYIRSNSKRPSILAKDFKARKDGEQCRVCVVVIWEGRSETSAESVQREKKSWPLHSFEPIVSKVEHLREPLELSIMSLALRSRACQMDSEIQLRSSNNTVHVSSAKSCEGSVFSFHL